MSLDPGDDRMVIIVVHRFPVVEKRIFVGGVQLAERTLVLPDVFGIAFKIVIDARPWVFCYRHFSHSVDCSLYIRDIWRYESSVSFNLLKFTLSVRHWRPNERLVARVAENL